MEAVLSVPGSLYASTEPTEASHFHYFMYRLEDSIICPESLNVIRNGQLLCVEAFYATKKPHNLHLFVS
jgi:hypothetical protein